jgi:ribose/xylose/arabinose/galactoside ABC-type transport system permease subunit
LTRDSGAFLTAYNWRTIAVQSVIVGTVALGMTQIMIAGGIDLSVGSAVALVTVAVASLVEGFRLPLPFGATVGLPERLAVPGMPLALAMLGGVALGGLCGLFNGALIARLGVVPFIITLGTMKMFRGLAKWASGSTSVYINEQAKRGWFEGLLSTDSPLPGFVERVAGASPEGVRSVLESVSRLAPGVWALLILSLFVALVLRYSIYGRYLYAVGSNEATANLCGIRVPRLKLMVYTAAGLLTGLGGVLQFTYLGGTGDPTTAEGLELQVIAAVVIGGGSLAGGEGRVSGTLIGVLIMSVLNNGCVHAGIPNASQDILIGAIIIAAVAIDRYRRSGRG